MPLGRVSLPFWRWRSIFTPHRGLGASGPVLGGGWCWGVSLFFGVQWFPPCFNTPRLPVASNRRLHNLAAPRAGRIGHCLKKVAAAESGFPEVIGGFWESPVGLVFPLSVVPVGDFWGGLTFGPCWVACGLPAPCAFGILWGWNIRAVRRGGVPFEGGSNPCFQHG